MRYQVHDYVAKLVYILLHFRNTTIVNVLSDILDVFGRMKMSSLQNMC